MATPAQALRLHIRLEPGCVLRVLDRLAVCGHMPTWMLYRHLDEAEGALWLELPEIEAAASANLVARIEQMPCVICVERGASNDVRGP